MNYPYCKTVDTKEVFFGKELPYPHSWLRDAKNPEVLEWVKQENEFTDNYFANLKDYDLDKKIQELKSKTTKPKYTNVIKSESGFYALKENEGLSDLVILDKNFTNEKILIKKDKFANENFSFLNFIFCPLDKNLIGLLGIVSGEAKATIKIYDINKDKVLHEVHDLFSYCWSKTKKSIYYTEFNKKDNKNYFVEYNIDSNIKNTIVLEKSGALDMLFTSNDNRSIIINLQPDYCSSNIFLYDEIDKTIKDLTPTKPFNLLYIGAINDKQYFITFENAPKGKLVSVSKNNTLEEAITVFNEGEYVLDAGFIKNGEIYLHVMDHVASKLIKLENINNEIEINLPSKLGTLTPCNFPTGVNHTSYDINNFENDSVFYFESLIDAPQLLLFDGENYKKLYSTDDKTYENLTVERKFAKSKDNTLVPYFMVYRKDLIKDGNNPTLMYAYGGYNCPSKPQSKEWVTNIDVREWANKGYIYVLLNIRGGNEYGSPWHEMGYKLNKKNCYYDFISITEQIIADKWTNPKKIAISGCSNGGLLMSTLVTMRPDLFGCVIDSVPHTDMIHFAEDDRGPMYVTEYGDPKESEEMFEYLLSYSPYHNVKEVEYPPVYIQTGENDNNVPPYHGKTFAAKMQASNKSDNPILLRVLKNGSHDRGSGEEFYRTTAEMYIFIQNALNLND